MSIVHLLCPINIWHFDKYTNNYPFVVRPIKKNLLSLIHRHSSNQSLLWMYVLVWYLFHSESPLWRRDIELNECQIFDWEFLTIENLFNFTINVWEKRSNVCGYCIIDGCLWEFIVLNWIRPNQSCKKAIWKHTLHLSNLSKCQKNSGPNS